MPERSDIEVVLGNNDAFCRRDLDGMLSFYAPDAVVSDRRPGGFGEYAGVEGLRAYYGGIFDNAESVREEIDIVSDEGGTVLASCRTVVGLSSAMGSGDFATDYALLIDVRDGLITRLEVYADVDSALASRR